MSNDCFDKSPKVCTFSLVNDKIMEKTKVVFLIYSIPKAVYDVELLTEIAKEKHKTAFSPP
jgi:hypothetical protein